MTSYIRRVPARPAAVVWSAVALFCFSCPMTRAQEAAPQVGGVTMSIFPVERGADGNQYIITRAGYKVTVPGLGISPDAAAIAVYRSPENQFWYVDKNGATQPVSASQLQWTMAQINQQQAMREAEMGRGQPFPQMPMPGQAMPGQVMSMPVTPSQAPAQQTVVVQSAPNSSQSGVGTAMVSGMAAATGAMAGSAIANSMYYNNNNGYHGIPYGAPCYNQNGHHYYNGADGAHEIPMHTDNPYMNEWSRQQAYQNNSQNRQNAYNNLNGNQQQMLKNQGAVRMDQRSATETSAAAAGESHAEGDQQVRQNRFKNREERFGGMGGGRFRR